VHGPELALQMVKTNGRIGATSIDELQKPFQKEKVGV
jgi:hypothetical protein